MLDIVASYHCMQFHGKLMSQTWENGKKKVILGATLVCLTQIWTPKNFSWVLPLLDVRHCCNISLYAISRKTNDPNSMAKKTPHSGPDLQ